MSEGLTECGLNDIRARLNRPDVTGSELIFCIEEALAGLGLTLTAEELLIRPAGDEQKRQVLSRLALPQPRLGLAMPEHDLRPEKSSRNALAPWTKRLTFALASSRKT